MPDVQLLRLNRSWALAYDPRQWIIQQRVGPGEDGADEWRARKFVTTTGTDLHRTFAKLKIKVSRSATLDLDGLPPTFGEFFEQRGVDRPEDDMRSKRHGRSRRKDGAPAPPKAPHSVFTVLDGERGAEAA